MLHYDHSETFTSISLVFFVENLIYVIIENEGFWFLLKFLPF